MTYVFRNNTIERFFSGDYIFSGYGDYSVSSDADKYIWWYQLPLKYDSVKLSAEINSYADKLLYISEQIGNKQFIVLTLEILYSANCNESDREIECAVEKFNQTAITLSIEKNNIKVFDIHDFTKDYPVSELIDWKFWFMSQMPLNPRLSNKFQVWLDGKIKSIETARKKCLVLDLDNTLWSGVLGEDGVNGIKLSGDYPGKAYHYWQEGIKSLAHNGVILAICSKNNEKDVIDVWQKRDDMVLLENDFSCKKINWENKADNIASIAKELNIGLDSIVFIDDNPTERELVHQMLPMVETPEWPSQPYLLPEFYKHIVNEYFTVYRLTEEDRKKTEQYRQNAERAQALTKFTNVEDFIRSLEIELTIAPINSVSLHRVAQMTQKTNQFNLTTKRYSESDIQRLLDNGALIYTLAVKDKFGDNGITGCIILCKYEDYWRVDTLLLSCRVLGKGIEYAFVKSVLLQLNCDTILSEYIPSEKNVQVENFYDKLGLNVLQEKDGVKYYKAQIKTLDLQTKDYYKIYYNGRKDS